MPFVSFAPAGGTRLVVVFTAGVHKDRASFRVLSFYGTLQQCFMNGVTDADNIGTS